MAFLVNSTSIFNNSAQIAWSRVINIPTGTIQTVTIVGTGITTARITTTTVGTLSWYRQ